MNFQLRLFGCDIPKTASEVSPACNYAVSRSPWHCRANPGLSELCRNEYAFLTTAQWLGILNHSLARDIHIISCPFTCGSTEAPTFQ